LKPITHRLKVIMSFIFVIIFLFGCSSCSSKYSNILDGTWYEQNENGSILNIIGNEIKYTKDDLEYICKFDAKETEKYIQIIPLDESFILDDLTYYYDDFSLLGHIRSSKDSNYSSVVYGKGIYIAPEPVQGEFIDKTDADAPKSISDYTIKSFYFVYNIVPGEGDIESDESKSTQYGKYEYSINKNEAGNWLLSSLFCQDIIVDDDWVQSFGGLIEELDIAAFNGYDKRIYMLSDDYPDYTIDIVFVSGETIHSSANSNYVTDAWYSVQNKLSEELFSAVVNGGYDPKTNDYHTTQPIKRVGLSEEEQNTFGISIEEKRIEKDGKKYTYRNYVDFNLFSGGDKSYSDLLQSLNIINEQISSSAKEDLENYFLYMEDIPADERKDVEDIYSYSFYQIDRLHSDEKLFWFRLSSGHSSNLISQDNNNSFTYNRYCFDPNTGKRISPAQLFTNKDWFEADLIKRLLELYKEGEVHDAIDSFEFRSSLHNMLSEPDTFGYIEWEPSYHYFTVYIPYDLIPVLDYKVEVQYYYDEYQQELNDEYAGIW